MTAQELLGRLRERFPEHRFEREPRNPEAIRMSPSGVPGVMEWLRDDPETRLEFLVFATAQDHPPERISLVYYLQSYEKKHRFALKVELPRDNPTIPTVSHLWQSADWNEREIYDLFGVVFTGHPDLRRIMMPEDWAGYPLRKDYLHPNLAVRED